MSSLRKKRRIIERIGNNEAAVSDQASAVSETRKKIESLLL